MMTKFVGKYLRASTDLKLNDTVILVKGNSYYVHEYITSKECYIITAENGSFQVLTVAAFCDPINRKLHEVTNGEIHEFQIKS
jgi:hypothetical protein